MEKNKKKTRKQYYEHKEGKSKKHYKRGHYPQRMWPMDNEKKKGPKT
jgi:hypothetical protein